MSVKLGINGFGRIGKIAIRAAFEAGADYEICGINLRNANLDYMAYMLKYDSVFGRFPGSVEHDDQALIINGKRIPVFSESDAAYLRWDNCGAEYIIEATGAYLTEEKSCVHLASGAKKVIISAPAKSTSIPTFVYGVNTQKYSPEMEIVSAASCTTNCLAPLCRVLQDNFGIEHGLMSTIHAATAKQHPVDSRFDKDWRVGRSTFGNVIPTSTGVAKAFNLVFPELSGRVSGIAYRVPTADVSLVDFNVLLQKDTNYAEICACMKEASETYLKDVLAYTEDKVVSSDFIKCSCPSAFDATMGLELNNRFFKLIAYYDNEWGYTCNLLRLAKFMAQQDGRF